jgi:putative spermidine/putrescine transport system substrate-binding protein
MVYMMRGTLPIQLIRQFKRQAGKPLRVQMKLQTQPSDAFAQLQRWQQTPPPSADLPQYWILSLGDYWLAQAIAQGLITPMADATLPQLAQVLEPWKSLARRDRNGQPAANGQLWGAPYRWGSTAIVYRKDKLQDIGLELKDWSDLWRPELRQRLTVLDQPREVIGLTLKSLGQSYNHPQPTQVPQLAEKLRSLHQQVRAYQSTHYLQPLTLGDTWVAVGWSNDILPALERESNLGAILPQSGSALWADLWVQPAMGKDTQIIPNWVQFWWQPTVAAALTQFTETAAIIPNATQAQKNHPLLNPESGWLGRSEPLLPLTPAARAEYAELWRQMRVIAG